MTDSVHDQTRERAETFHSTAANDNPGGATSVEMHLSSFVTVLAKAYVAKERSA